MGTYSGRKFQILLKLFIMAIAMNGNGDLFAQAGGTVLVDINQNPPTTKFQIGLTDSVAIYSKAYQFRQNLISEGFLTASIDSIILTPNDTNRVYYFQGSRYLWGNLSPGNAPEEMLSFIGFREEIYRSTPLNANQISSLFSKILDYSENNGFPFAQIGLDSLSIDRETIRGSLNYERGDFVTLDSLIIKGGITTNRSYIENYLGFRKGKPYDQSALRKIPNRLREIPFISTIKPYEIGMRPGKADVYLYLENKKASNFDGVLGVLPDPETGDILFTGDVKLNLLNSLKKGETINLQWQRLRSQTSQLDILIQYPFLFNTPLGLEFKLNLYRRDTTFSQNRVNIGVEYYLPGNDKLKIYYESFSANTIGSSNEISGGLADSRTNLFGLGAFFADLDYRFNPRRGYLLELSGAAGEKRILSEIEEDQNRNSDLYTSNADLNFYFPLFKRSAIKLRVQGGLVINERLFQNEIYRIGGLKTLRGFDEQAIFASGYSIATIEYRFILEQNSNLFLFFDQAYYENQNRLE